jgi:glycosyltransferase involved in cell wall biosynthesis
MKKILFYSRVHDLTLFEKVGFYAIDIDLLRGLGYEVVTTNNLRDVIFQRYDIFYGYFYTWTAIGVAICRVLSRRSIVTGGADDLASYYKARSPITRLTLKLTYRFLYLFVDRIMVVSTSDRINLSKISGGQKLFLVPHAVDVERFAVARSKISRTLLTIGWFGEGNVIRKGMDSAIRLLAALRARNEDFKLTVAGLAGPGLKYLKSLSDQLGVSSHVDFRVNVTEDEKVELLQSSGYYVQLSEYEGFGLAALEALSCGCCVVHTGRGGLADFMGEFGICHSWPLDIEALADEIVLKSADSDGDGQAKIRHQHVKARFSLDQRCKSIEAHLNELLPR